MKQNHARFGRLCAEYVQVQHYERGKDGYFTRVKYYQSFVWRWCITAVSERLGDRQCRPWNLTPRWNNTQPCQEDPHPPASEKTKRDLTDNNRMCFPFSVMNMRLILSAFGLYNEQNKPGGETESEGGPGLNKRGIEWTGSPNTNRPLFVVRNHTSKSTRKRSEKFKEKNKDKMMCTSHCTDEILSVRHTLLL